MGRRTVVTFLFVLLSFTMVGMFYSEKYSHSIMDKLGFVSDENASMVYRKQSQVSLQTRTQPIVTTRPKPLDKRFLVVDKNSVILQNASFCPFHLVPAMKRNGTNSTCLKYNWSDKHKILSNLEKKISGRIYELQNPNNCSTARLLVCSLQTNLGLGSLTHFLAQCVVLSLLTNRTMVTEISKQYYKDIDAVFLPLSKTCAKVDFSKAVDIQGMTNLESTSSYQIIKTSMASLSSTNKKYYVFAMPKSIADVVECLHGEPDAWWIGQIAKYLLRIYPPILENVNKIKAQINLSQPIIGLHIRRGDKFKEARFYPVKNYMAYAERWFDCNYISKGINITKKIYVATDEPKVIEELETNYQDYQIMRNPLLYNVSLAMVHRYEKTALISVLTDIHILSECDYFIGTYSSNIGRLIYEIKQANLHPVYSSLSLDQAYHYHLGFNVHHIFVKDQPGGGNNNNLKIGDEIIVNGGGSSVTTGVGYNLRTKANVHYPIDNVRVLVKTASYPEFS